MRRFLGVEQKATDRTIKEWKEGLSEKQRQRMNIPKEKHTLQATFEIVNHFGNFFKPNNK